MSPGEGAPTLTGKEAEVRLSGTGLEGFSSAGSDRFASGLSGDPAEAHSLPIAREFFDAIVSFDAYHYFGTDDLYLGYISQFVRPGGFMAIVVPGIVQEVTGGVPSHLAAQWQWDQRHTLSSLRPARARHTGNTGTATAISEAKK